MIDTASMITLVDLAAEAVRLKHRSVRYQIRRAVSGGVHVKQFDETVWDLTAVLTPLFVEQIQSMARRLGELGERSTAMEEKSAADGAAVLVKHIFDPAEWHDRLVDLALPVLAVKMAEAGVAYLLTLGIDRRKGFGTRAKQTTASEWLAEHSEDVGKLEEMLHDSGVPIRVMTELPDWMKRSISRQLTDTFAQPYWRDIHKVTEGHAEEYLRQGLEEGWSIRRMSDTMATTFKGGTLKYAKMRATRIAITESGGALNGARRASMDQLAEELGPQVPMKPAWHSALMDTTRDSHANLDGVPADEEGLFNVGGYRVPYPGHVSLSAGERVNCFPAGTLVQGDFVGAQRAWYEGVFTEIVFRFGGRIAVTPNHKIVTSEGLVPAGQIKPGQKVMTYTAEADPSPMVAAGGNEIKHKPVPIEQLFEAFLSAGAAAGRIEVRRAQVNDFYGDAKSFQGDIEIVWTDWSLLNDGKFGQFEKCGDTVFVLEPGELSCKSSFGPSLFNRKRIAAISSSRPCGAQGLSDDFWGFKITPSGSLAIGQAADFNVCLDKSAAEEGSTVSGFLRESIERYPGFVAFDDVVEIRNFYSAGHVYDLQGKYGLIMAYDELYTNIGIMSSNCYCTLLTEFGMGEEESLRLIQEHEERRQELAEPKPKPPEKPEVRPSGLPSTPPTPVILPAPQLPEIIGPPSPPTEMLLDRQAVNRQLNRTSGKIRGLDHERLVVLNRDGTISISKDGGKDFVEMTAVERNAMKSRVSLHNHPGVKGRASTFSTEDITGAIQRGEWETNVVTHQGGRFRMTFGDKLQELSKAERNDLAKRVGKDYIKTIRAQAKMDIEKIRAGEVTANRSVLQIGDDGWKAMAEKHGFVYEGLR